MAVRDVNHELQSMTQAEKFRCCLRLLRFRDWSVQSGIFLLGAFFADDLLTRDADFILSSLTLSCLCLAYGYSLNEFYDDMKERLAGNGQAAGQLIGFIYGLLALAVAVAWLISPKTFAIVSLIGLTVWLHSAPPLRLKTHLFWRFFLNSLGFGLFFLAGASLDNRVTAGEILMGAFIFGLYLPLELIHVLAHQEADRAKGLRTFATVHGERKTTFLTLSLLCGLILYAGALWQFGFMKTAPTFWTVLNLLMLLGIVASFGGQNSIEAFGKLRLRAKITCLIFGSGLLMLLAGKI